ncbi:hypothetical protein, partial [Salmonella enterica]|uniref:hypothetical protein n=1 Tax=Salmonella enterica TaxID=28901 RepID=UPI00111C746B
MMVIPLSELRKKLDRHGYIPQSREDNDELIQLLDIRGPTPAGSCTTTTSFTGSANPISGTNVFPLALCPAPINIHSVLPWKSTA